MTFSAEVFPASLTQKSLFPRTHIAKLLDPTRVFLLGSILFGIPLCFLTAPFEAPDEGHHFLRSYQLSEGGIIPARRGSRGGGELPISLMRVMAPFRRLRFNYNEKISRGDLDAAMRIELDAKHRAFTPFVTAIYSPAAYIPQALAMAIGRVLGLHPLALMYAGRLANLLAWIVLGFASLRVAPQCARAWMLLLLMPMSLFQAASLSADATTNGLAILFTALIWQMASTPALPRSRAAEACPMRSYQSWKKVTLLAGLIMLLALTKFAYLPLAALVLLIPSSCLGGRGRYVTVVALLFLAGLCALAAWVPQTHGLDTTIRVTPKVLASHQAAELAAHPSRLITVPIATFFRDALFLLKSFIGRLGSLDIPLSTIFIIPYALMLLAACWPSQNDSQAVDARRAMLVISMSVGACIAAIGLLNYIFWTPVGSRQIDGLQGRYLIPLAPAVIILLRTLLRKLPAAWWMNRHEWRLDATAAAMAFMGGAYTLIAVYLRYY